MEKEDTVEMVESVLVNLKLTGTGSGDSEGVTTVVEDKTCNEGAEAVGGRDGDNSEIDDPDTMAVGVKERDEEEVVIAGDSLELSSIGFSRVCT
jgi:hypothetical protein